MADEVVTWTQALPKSSIARVTRYDFMHWMENKYPDDGWKDQLQTAVVALGNNPTLTNLVKANAQRLAAIFFTDRLNVTYASQAGNFTQLVAGTDMGQNLGLANQRGPNWNLTKARMKAWMDGIQTKIWDRWLDSMVAGRTRRDPISDVTGDWTNAGNNAIAAEVYLIIDGAAVMQGDMYSAQLGDNGNHAEIQWKNAHAATFLQNLPNATRAELRITKVTCVPCAEVFIPWYDNSMRGILPDNWEGVYIYTVKDGSGRHYVYELDESSVLRIGGWT